MFVIIGSEDLTTETTFTASNMHLRDSLKYYAPLHPMIWLLFAGYILRCETWQSTCSTGTSFSGTPFHSTCLRTGRGIERDEIATTHVEQERKESGDCDSALH